MQLLFTTPSSYYNDVDMFGSMYNNIYTLSVTDVVLHAIYSNVPYV